MFRCNECLELFEEPTIHETTFENFLGISDQFSSRTYLKLELCPECGSDDIEEIEESEEK